MKSILGLSAAMTSCLLFFPHHLDVNNYVSEGPSEKVPLLLFFPLTWTSKSLALNALRRSFSCSCRILELLSWTISTLCRICWCMFLRFSMLWFPCIQDIFPDCAVGVSYFFVVGVREEGGMRVATVQGVVVSRAGKASFAEANLAF